MVLRTLSRPLIVGVERYLPSSFVFAIVLTIVVAVMALGLTDSGPVDVARAWGDGLAGLLAFMTQISLVLLLGYTFATTPPVERVLLRIASVPRTPRMAYAFVTLVAALASLISFGLGLVVGGVMALEVGRAARRRGMQLHYPLLVACAYSGFVVWHMGYSASGPLAAATPGSFVEEQLGAIVPVSETLFAPWNLAAIVVVVIAIMAAMVALAPRENDPVIELPDAVAEPDHSLPEHEPLTPAERVDHSRVLTLVPGLALVGYLAVYFSQEGFDLTLDIVNWSFLAAILLLVTSPRELGTLIGGATHTLGEVLLQYPFYAGIIGMMTVTGLVEVFSEFFTNVSSAGTLGLWAFLAGGLLNLFVPSGGGQFAVQAPIFLDAGGQLGVDPSVVIMAIAYGDQWTNMIQPFWALPLLAVAGLGVRDILGFTAITLLVSGVVFSGTLLLVGAG